ncbi:hypothetical protein [Clostridium isatidis]|uniref:Uncharacterized protein n=1 Tax=Clostridium isatidis TaxID=182773 RepID=A0A343JB07_9CLOT|nr:hypothetical protein [Clostridium isatidis]ASW42715.1 hypothetical protein BEN51_04250 [Clostridium isatidis]NLZ34406.1 hypothetical protein [Clostridiales bacterium]
MIEIKNKVLEEKIKQLKKAIEIVGGKNFLDSLENDNKLAELLIEKSLTSELVEIEINCEKHLVNNLYKKKLEYEKSYIKNKKKNIDKIVYKIKKYNTYLDSLIRKYKKDQSYENLLKIKEEIELRYKNDIDNFILSEINNLKEDNKEYYGEFLKSKKEDFINLVLHSII